MRNIANRVERRIERVPADVAGQHVDCDKQRLSD
jgi:hypothetical protein